MGTRPIDPVPRTRARRLPPDVRRAELLATATQLFVDHGESFTIADLAEAAQVAEGTIFRYFEDKAELVAQCRRSALGMDRLFPQLEAAYDIEDLRERLVVAGTALHEQVHRTARAISDSGHDERPSPELVCELVAAMTPLFDDSALCSNDSERPICREQLVIIFVGVLLTNAVLTEQSGVTALPVEGLVDFFLHGAAT